MDQKLRELERNYAAGDTELRHSLYLHYFRLGYWHKAGPLVKDEIMSLDEGRNQSCFPLYSYGWKDADLEPWGCTGIKHVKSRGSKGLNARVGGHKTFAPDEELLDDEGYMNAVHEIVAWCGYPVSWSGDDWSAHTEEVIRVEWLPTLHIMALEVINRCRKAIQQYQDDMKDTHESFYATPPSVVVCQDCNGEHAHEDEELIHLDGRWLCSYCYHMSTDIVH